MRITELNNLLDHINKLIAECEEVERETTGNIERTLESEILPLIKQQGYHEGMVSAFNLIKHYIGSLEEPACKTETGAKHPTVNTYHAVTYLCGLLHDVNKEHNNCKAKLNSTAHPIDKAVELGACIAAKQVLLQVMEYIKLNSK